MKCEICGASDAKSVGTHTGVMESWGFVCEGCITKQIKPLFMGFESVHSHALKELKDDRVVEWKSVGICPECGPISGDSVNSAPPTPSTCSDCGSTLSKVGEQRV